jgi:lactose/L-arabinose transport system substrate-binding protein
LTQLGGNTSRGIGVNDGTSLPSRWLHTVVGLALLIILCGSFLASLNLSRGERGATATALDPIKLERPEQLDGELTVWGWNVAAKSLRSLLPAFRERYPKVRVNVEMTGTNVQARFLLSLSSGTGAPDVMQLQAYESPRYLATGRMTDLTAVAAKYEKDFPPASWANCVHAGRVYAIPWDIGPCAVFYKRDLFRKYHVDPDKIETWDDFIAAGKQILEQSGGRTKMMALSPGDLLPTYEIFLQQVHGQVFDEQGRVAIDSPQSRRALDLIRRLLDAGICASVDQFSHEWMAGLNADTIATYPAAVWLGGTMKDTTGQYISGQANWGVFPLPAFERGGLRASNLGGSVLVIPDQCPNKEAAWAFVQYALCTREGQVTQYANFDLFPAYLPALKDPFFEQPDAYYGGQKVRALFAGSVEGIPVVHRTSDWVEAMNYARQSFTAWAVNHEPTEPTLEQLARKLERRLGRAHSPAEAAR